MSDRQTQQLARALGWFSVGVGLAELLAPKFLGRITGIEDRENLMRVMGARELATGIGILTSSDPAPWMWARVGGDVLDLASLAALMLDEETEGERGTLAAVTTGVSAITAMDVYCALTLAQSNGQGTARMPRVRGVHVVRSITIQRPARDIYRFWRDFENLPRFMHHLESVEDLGRGFSHWIAKAPLGTSIEWDAEIINDQENAVLAWRSLEGGAVEHSGSVRFESAPHGRGTIVRVTLEYRPVGGKLGALAARIFGKAPEQQVAEDLRRLKQVMETGEISTTKGQPRGTCRS